MLKSTPNVRKSPRSGLNLEGRLSEPQNVFKDLLGIVVQPLDLHLLNVGSIPTGLTHGEERLKPHHGAVLKSKNIYIYY